MIKYCFGTNKSDLRFGLSKTYFCLDNKLFGELKGETIMVKKTQTAKNEKEQKEIFEEPKRLSKIGEWMKAPPKGFLGIHDMRAVMK